MAEKRKQAPIEFQIFTTGFVVVLAVIVFLFIAYAPFMGIFAARISRGRTFRDVVLTALTFGTLGCAMFFGIFGNNAMYQFILVIFVFVGFVYSATTVNSSAYSIATVASKDMTEATDVEPNLYNRVLWAVFLGAIALALMYQDEAVRQTAAAGREAVETARLGTSSVLKALKTSSLVVALPLMVCIFISVLSFFKWIKQDKPHLEEGKLTEDGE